MIGSGSARFAMVGALPLLFILSIGAVAQTLSLDIRVASGNDDAEESLSGSMYLNSSDLELVDDASFSGADQTIGLRFLGVDIPPGSKILNAYVQFQVDESDSGAVDLVIRGQASGLPAAFSSSSGDITSRPVTTASVAWSPPPWTSVGAAGPDQRTPDLAEILQKIIELPDWAAGNPMVIIITGSGERTAESYNGSSSGAPLLHVVYDPTGGAPPNELPTASFTATPETGEAPLTVSFDAGASDDTDGTIVSYGWDYGDGTTGTGETASRDYDAAGSYTVTLTVTDDLGATGSATYPLTFTGNQAPTARFTYATISTDAPFTVDFDAGASDDIDGSIISFDWDYGDSTTGTAASHVYGADGTYVATLTVTDDDGVPDTTQRTVTLIGNQAPVASFTATPNSGIAPLSVSFDANGSSDTDGSIASHAWDYGDGTQGAGATASHAYNVPGIYSVTLTVTDDLGKTSTTSSSVTATVAGPIDIRVASGNDDAEELQSGSMSRSSSDLELADDGTRRPNQTIAMRFLGVDIPPGSKILNAHVQFQVDESDSGAVDLVIRGQASGLPAAFSSSSGDITSRPVTTASVAWSPPPWTSVGAAGPDQRTPDLAEILQKIIELPDWAAGNPMVIIITGSGERTAESYNGSSSGAPLLHVVYDPTGGAPPNELPTASFTATPETGEAPLTVSFDAGASDDTDGTIVSYGWDYGDGTTGTGETASRDYDAAGSYTVTLTVTDDLGATGSATYPLTFTGNQAPTARFTYATISTDAPFTVDFDAGASDDIDGSIISFDWDYGDSTTGTAASHVYGADGTYVATLTVTDDDGVPDTTQRTVTLIGNQAPVASFTATPNSGIAPLSVSFDATASADSDGSIASYTWDYGYGSPGAAVTASHAYNVPGIYSVTLTVTDNLGKTGTMTSTVTAIDPTALQPLKVAFIGDQDNDDNAEAVLSLIAAEGTGMVLHQGDFDYSGNPTDWDNRISGILGADFPYFASPGNHDTGSWSGSSGYQAKLIARLGKIPEASCTGDYGVQSACTYKGLFFILSGAGTIPNNEDNPSQIAFITDQLAQTNATMRICSWHKNQNDMQVGSKSNEVGWGPYEACREGGAIIATAHEHSYSRTHLLDHFKTQSIADTSDTIRIEKGKTFAFVSGLGGRSIRNQDQGGPWWASIYTSSQGADYGALFCDFFVGGDPTRASCYFKDINGNVPDQFEIISAISGLVADFTATPGTGEAPLAVDFDAASSVALQGSITAYDWDFGDGATGSGQTISRQFVDIGTYTVTLTVTDDTAKTATTTLAVTTTGPVPNQAPTASFTATPSSGNVPLFVALDASASSDSDGTIHVYDWDFDDGTTATGASVNHSFVNPGTYAVNLTITDNDGATDSATTFVAAGVAVPAIDVRVSSGNDDAEENQSGSVNLSSSDLELADETSAGNPNQTIGMRFVGVDITQGATIVDAHVQFQVDESDSGTVSLVIRGQAADDASAFSSSSGDVTSRPVTSESVAWSPPPWTNVGAAGADQRTPDLSAIVQEIIDRTDWSPGNALAIIITGTGERTAESYNGSSSGAPLLHVEYVSSPSG